MKCSEFKKLLESLGCEIRDGSNHWIAYRKGYRPQPIPRHPSQEIHEGLRKTIVKDLASNPNQPEVSNLIMEF